MAERRDLAPDEDLGAVFAAHETVFVQFHADWCAPCAVLTEFFTEVEDDLVGLVLEVDIEMHDDVAAVYDGSTNPTLLIVEDGDVVERREGLPDRPGFRELVAPWR